MIAIVDDVRAFRDGRATITARTAAHAIAVTEGLGLALIDKLWLEYDLCDHTCLPLVDHLAACAAAGTPVDVGHILVHSARNAEALTTAPGCGRPATLCAATTPSAFGGRDPNTTRRSPRRPARGRSQTTGSGRRQGLAPGAPTQGLPGMRPDEANDLELPCLFVSQARTTRPATAGHANRALCYRQGTPRSRQSVIVVFQSARNARSQGLP